MTDTAHHSCKRPWYRRPLVWILGVVLLGLMAFGVVEFSGRTSPLPLSYSDFLAQLDAGNVASVTFNDRLVDGKFKRPLSQATTKASAAQSVFSSQVPAVGDPTLLPELRKDHVVIDVVASSGWLAWLGRLPWPLVLILAFVLVAGAIKLMPGGQVSGGSALSAHSTAELIAGLFGKHGSDREVG